MSSKDMRIAFYAPLKPPTHPTPSGDRKMARLLMQALAGTGHETRLVSEFRSYARSPEPVLLAEFRAVADAEVQRIVGEVASGGFRPDLWFTYHLYYKAPDLVGPAVARRLGIPYVAAEASWSARRDSGEWAIWQRAAEEGLRAARVIFCFAERDRQGLENAPDVAAHLIDLKPFLNPAPLRRKGPIPADAETRLLAVAMMRPGGKRESYLLLAGALRLIADQPWRLTVIGDGAARVEIETAFAGLPEGRVAFLGLADEATVASAMAASDVLVWPGIREAYGLVFLEAAAQGLPALAFDYGGVHEVLIDGRTGVLLPPPAHDGRDVERYALALRGLLDDPARRTALAGGALRFARIERGMDKAAATLAHGLKLAVNPELARKTAWPR